MSTKSPCLYLAFTSAVLSDGIAQVRSATVIDDVESEAMLPRASLFSLGCRCGLQPFPPTSTAAPPEVPPPNLPEVNPVAAANPADMLATSATGGSCARPTARP